MCDDPDLILRWIGLLAMLRLAGETGCAEHQSHGKKSAAIRVECHLFHGRAKSGTVQLKIALRLSEELLNHSSVVQQVLLAYN